MTLSEKIEKFQEMKEKIRKAIISKGLEAKDEDFPLNTPVLIAGSLTQAAKLDTTGTLPAVLEGILAQT